MSTPSEPTTAPAPAQPSAPQMTFYMRPLPDSLVSFNSPEGRAIFDRAMSYGRNMGKESTMDSFFLLISHLVTQADPAFCGLGTLATSLNALQVDPKRPWKGVWRYYDESLLDCCRPLDIVRKQGITLAEFACLARCNSLRAEVKRFDLSTEEEFREAIRNTSSYLSKGGDSAVPAVLCVSYHRGTLGQTGDGHFSPVGGYSPADDKILILDVARFKYPIYWADVKTVWESLGKVDSVSGKPRGFVILSRATDPPPFHPTSLATPLPPSSTPLTTLTLTTLSFRHFFTSIDTQPPSDLNEAKELIAWALEKLKQVTVGIEDGGGRFAIVERVREVAIPNGAENGTDKEGNGAGEDLEWKGLAEAIELHPMYTLISAYLSSLPSSPNQLPPNTAHLSTLSLILLIPRLTKLKSSAQFTKLSAHLSTSLEGLEMEPVRRELENLKRQWDALYAECCGTSGHDEKEEEVACH